jgi:diguanylate cyclase (GGDEF)-like protein/PAS domain S-box-containing protein
VVLDTSDDVTMRVGRDHRIEYVNRRAVEVTGIPFEEWIGKKLAELGFPAETFSEMEVSIQRVLDTGEPVTYENETDNLEGHRWYETIVVAQVDSTDSAAHVILTSRDITDRKHDEAELLRLATHDPLTGLANRASLLDEIERALRADRRSGRATAVVLLDLDHFKDVNDTMGHAAGDALLIAVARRLETVVRVGDLVARLGGDEFVVAMRDLEEPAEAVRAAGRLVEANREGFAPAGVELFATASIGVAIATETSDASDLIREADTAMYAAKDAGRDRVSVYNEDLRTAVATRLAVESDLRHALERGQLAVWYQPEIDLTTGTVTAVEALLRWHHPDGSVWTADRFIDVAEDTGLILDIGNWVLRQAATQAAKWAADRPDRPLTVRVNASALQLAEPGLLAAIDEALTASSLDPGLLCMEITETALLHQTTTAIANLAGIHDRGIALALDDFGTGYASLTYLRLYPVNVLKIDRSFITHLTTNDHDRQITAGIIALANALNITVTAEGVEHPDQAALLHQMGCPSAQGWLYSKALPVEDVTPLLDRAGPWTRLHEPAAE